MKGCRCCHLNDGLVYDWSAPHPRRGSLVRMWCVRCQRSTVFYVPPDGVIEATSDEGTLTVLDEVVNFTREDWDHAAEVLRSR